MVYGNQYSKMTSEDFGRLLAREEEGGYERMGQEATGETDRMLKESAAFTGAVGASSGGGKGGGIFDGIMGNAVGGALGGAAGNMLGTVLDRFAPVGGFDVQAFEGAGEYVGGAAGVEAATGEEQSDLSGATSQLLPLLLMML